MLSPLYQRIRSAAPDPYLSPPSHKIRAAYPEPDQLIANDLHLCHPERVATLTECPRRIAWLLDALDLYDSGGHYDEVFWKVHRQIAEQGDAGKAEICLVVCWKRAAQGHWLSDLLSMPEESVSRITRSAFAASGDKAKLDHLVKLPGFAAKGPLATALWCTHDPVEYGVMDWRARRGLDVVCAGLQPDASRTVHYLERVRQLRDEVRRERAETTAREIDKALWVLGAPTPSRIQRIDGPADDGWRVTPSSCGRCAARWCGRR